MMEVQEIQWALNVAESGLLLWARRENGRTQSCGRRKGQTLADDEAISILDWVIYVMRHPNTGTRSRYLDLGDWARPNDLAGTLSGTIQSTDVPPEARMRWRDLTERVPS